MFSQIFDAIEEWMRELLTGMITSNLDTMFTDGVTMETVCRKIADIVIEAPIQVDLKAILNYEDVKDNLDKYVLFIDGTEIK